MLIQSAKICANLRTKTPGTSAAWAFTPDTLAGQYVDCQTGRALFEQQFAELVVQPLLDDGSELLADRVYEIGMQELVRFPLSALRSS